MKQPIRAFAIGLFTAGFIILIVFFFTNQSDTPSAEELATEEMIDAIENEGYRVITETEYITMSVNKENNSHPKEEDKNESDKNKDEEEDKTNDDTSDQKEDEESEEEDEESEVSSERTYTLEIESGMPSSEIGTILEENNIIDDGNEFTQYLEEEEYTLLVQIGEHEVSSDMSFYEIAETITN
ncbi:hypothetical protein [Oceanobacillus halotolerans]|uniref:hypothetical protein n=1 Tax=Oceanobacillus halotolerans TaxID=2663380 RepID=UPI00196A1B21|nr:hypothetical protein [Oceanobacillus halotolerans]